MGRRSIPVQSLGFQTVCTWNGKWCITKPRTNKHRDIHASVILTVLVCVWYNRYVWFFLYAYMDVCKRDLMMQHLDMFIHQYLCSMDFFYAVLICSESIEYACLTLYPNKIIIGLHNKQCAPQFELAGWAVIELEGKATPVQTNMTQSDCLLLLSSFHVQ